MKHYCLIVFQLASLAVFSLSCSSAPKAVPTEVVLAQPTATLDPTSTPEPTFTSTPTETPIPTTTPNASATAQAATMEAVVVKQYAEKTAAAAAAKQTQQAEADLWAKLVDDGSITMTKGRLHTLDDFEESWAQRNWYRWWSFGYNLADFVLMTHVDWKSAPSDKTAVGGCGFVFRVQDENHHLLIIQFIDQTAGLGQMTSSGFEFQRKPWVNPDLKKSAEKEGSSDFLVAAEKEAVTVYINGVKAYRWYVARTTPGDIGYTIISGTNKDYGTYCNFTDTRVWELKK
jgi:hypothetical protein